MGVVLIEFLGSVRQVINDARASWRPPPKLTPSEWADQHFYLSAESSAQSGRWKTLPYQVGVLDEVVNPLTEQITWMKSARVGFTKCLNVTVGFFIDQDPCSMLLVQPTVDDAKGYSKEEIGPMLRDCPRLTDRVLDDDDAGPRDSGNTILHKKYAGGVFSMVGANSGAGFRRVSRRVILLDEVDAYPPSAGSDGDPVKLAARRADYFWNKKIVAGSTPLIAGHSRIEALYLAGDQRRFYVPCPTCGHRDHLVFTERETGGHYMYWPPGEPEKAHFVCSRSGCVIEHSEKEKMVARGEWRASAPFTGHASFHIWSAYSFSPGAEWKRIAQASEDATKGGRELLKTFVNTWLGETWKETGEAPEWERLYNRREQYVIGSVPAGVKFMTIGVDVQKDRFVYEVVGWGIGKESWSIEADVIAGDVAKPETWQDLAALLERIRALDPSHKTMLAIDSGYNTQHVYNWVRKQDPRHVIAIKGMPDGKQSVLVEIPKSTDVNQTKRIARGVKVRNVAGGIAKGELYAQLRLEWPVNDDGSRPAPPPGFCHFPEHGPEYFKQLTAEILVSVAHKRTGQQTLEWQVIPNRENHFLDCRVYARAAATVLGLDRWRPREAPPAPAAPPAITSEAAITRPAPAPPVVLKAPADRKPSDYRLSFHKRRGKGFWNR